MIDSNRKYQLQINFKTHFLNLFRRIFKWAVFEKKLTEISINNSVGIIKKFIPPNYLYDKNSYRFAERDGINYRLDISDTVDHYIYFGFRDEMFNLVAEDIKRANVIFDVGSNIGATVLNFAHYNPDAKIYAFEPHPLTYKRAEENIKLNKFKNIKLINSGIGNKLENLKLYEVNNKNSGKNRILFENDFFPFIEVSIDTIDNFIRNNNITALDILKIDVEGFEYFVIEGGYESILKYKPLIIIEINDNYLKEKNKSAEDLIKLLINNGYNYLYDAHDLSPFNPGHNLTNCHLDLIAKSIP